MSGRVRLEREGAVATLTFDNPARHNALTHAMADAAREHLARLTDADRVVVLRGAGERAFLSGADIGEQDDDHGRRAFLASANAMIAAIGALAQPVVALIHGYCLGAGVAVAAQADLRFAADDAVFGVPAARLGLGYPYAEVARLTALIGPGAAADLLLTARRASAAEAAAWGLVQALHPAPALDGAVAGVAAAIAANAPLSVRAAKRAVRAQAADRAAVDALVAACAASADYAEGRRAFLEKRAPRFTGR